ncbi:hypothetical protein [Inquilinus limosus]|uniref:hypothetical protein n=1 Tax=Inquilinus limosus TaxID=171674 RepID=UPI0012DD3E26|nr:hypothetical protein [Inquilinus limosus]
MNKAQTDLALETLAAPAEERAARHLRMLARQPRSRWRYGGDPATPSAMWALEDYLRRQRRHIDTIFDYRYSPLPFVFAAAICGGYLDEAVLPACPKRSWRLFHGDEMEGRPIVRAPARLPHRALLLVRRPLAVQDNCVTWAVANPGAE